jgi:uncharacterized membrane protein YhaH (DUF805 family)
MFNNKHLDNYKPPASSNEEKSYFLTYGRIRRRAFFLRTFLVIVIFVISNIIMFLYFQDQYDYWKNRGGGVVRNKGFEFWYNLYFIFNYYVLTALLLLFFNVQSAKRMHDVNKSGWYTLAPFLNIILWFTKGTVGQNEFGLDPKPHKVEKYYDNTLYECKECSYTQIRHGMKECPNCKGKLIW